MREEVPSPQPGFMNTITELPTALPHHSPHEGTLEYHRLARAFERYRWWKPLMVGLVASVAYCLLVALLFGVVALVGLAIPGLADTTDRFLNDPLEDVGEPSTYAIGMIMVALMLPALWSAIKVFGARPAGLVSSVAGRIRWGWLARCVGVAAVVYGAAQLGLVAVASMRGQSLAPHFDSPHTLALLGLALLLVPFQAAAEEYLFRGYLMQTLGGWVRHPAIAITLPMPLFVVGHDYELRGLMDIAVFALVAGWLTWRTGGLEAAIALHVVNNVVVSALGAFGFIDLNATSSTLTDLLVSLAMTLGFAFVVVGAADRTGIERVRSLAS